MFFYLVLHGHLENCVSILVSCLDVHVHSVACGLCWSLCSVHYAVYIISADECVVLFELWSLMYCSADIGVVFICHAALVTILPVFIILILHDLPLLSVTMACIFFCGELM